MQGEEGLRYREPRGVRSGEVSVGGKEMVVGESLNASAFYSCGLQVDKATYRSKRARHPG